MFRNLLIQLWKDESGVIATEYLMLSSIVAVGSAAGMAAMRDSITDEYKDFGQNVRETRQSFMKPAAHATMGTGAGATATQPGLYNNSPIGATGPSQPYTPMFSPPPVGQNYTPVFGAP